MEQQHKVRRLGRLSWDPNILSSSSITDSNRRRRRRDDRSTDDDPELTKLLARFERTHPTTPEVWNKSKFIYKEFPDKEEFTDLAEEEVKEATVVVENDDSSDEESSALTCDQRESFFGNKARSNFFRRHKKVERSSSYFHPSSQTKSEQQRNKAMRKFPMMGKEITLKKQEEETLVVTPRRAYLSGCAQEKLPPLPVIVRKRATTVFDFSYQGLGDACIIQFANALRDIPFVEEINVCDNRLSDIGLNALLLAIQHKPNLTMLDISMNEVGDETSVTLRNYLSSSLCTIEQLVLRKSDIDDYEAAAFMNAFEKNKSVHTLNLSQNRIGEAENLNVVQPDFTTGGEAIAEMLNVNLTLVRLDLSWNLLRLESAVTLAESLILNYHLIDLNVSYNACGEDGAMAFGKVLHANRTLKTLDLSYNNVGTKGAMVLANAITANNTLSLLKLNGNAIGKDGGRVLMFAMSSKTGENGCEVEMHGCNLGSSSKGVFNSLEPTGDYELNLEHPYDKMIATELLRLATYKDGCRFTKLIHKVSTVKTTIQLIKPIRQDITPVNVMFRDIDRDGSGSIDAEELLQVLTSLGMDAEQETVEHLVNEFDKDGSGTIDEDEFSGFFFHAVFTIIDNDGSGSLDALELKSALKILGIQPSMAEVDGIIRHYDVDGSGSIEKDEFVDFLETRAREEAMRKRNLTSGTNRALLDVSTNEAWEMPSEGTLSVSFISEKVATEDGSSSDQGVHNLIQNISRSPQRAALLDVAIDDTEIEFSADQAQAILKECGADAMTKLHTLAKLLPQMCSVNDAHKLISNELDLQERMKLRQLLGSLHAPIMGNATRYYYLDLSKPLDHRAAGRIAQTARAEREFSKKRSGRADTSQHGNWENFRNARFNSDPIVLTQSFFTSLPKTGILSFDYVSTARPKRGKKPMSDRRFSQLLSVLVENDVKDKWKRASLAIVDVSQAMFQIQKTKAGIERKIVEIEATLGNRWLSAAQAFKLVMHLPTDWNARAEMTRLLFPRIIDIDNFGDVIYDQMTLDEQRFLGQTLGLLNILNPMKPDRGYELHLHVKDERDMAKILVALAVDEPGENWLNESYFWVKGEPPVAGWELPASWAKEDNGNDGGPRRTGFLTLEYYSGADLGCAPVWSLRKELKQKVLSGTRLYL